MAWDNSQETSVPWGGFGDNSSAAIGSGLGQQLSNLSPDQLVYDPFQFQRPQYMEMLSNLMKDPNSITTTPWYTAGIESVKRGMSKGYLDSGNMALALGKYGQDAYYKQLTTLAALAGGNLGPTNVGNSIVGGKQAGADLQSKALGTQRYQDLMRLLQQSKGNGGPGSPWGAPGTPGGTKLPGYGQPTSKVKSGQPGPGQGGPGQDDPGDPWNVDNELRDIFGLDPDEDMSSIYDMFDTGGEGGGNDYSDYYGDFMDAGDFGGGE